MTLTDFIMPAIVFVVAIIFLIIGYAMGRNSAALPFRTIEKEKSFKPGPITEEEDQYDGAMYGEETEAEKKAARIETV